MHGCLVEILMVDGKGRSEDSLPIVGDTMKGMLRVVKYCGDKMFFRFGYVSKL